MNKILVRGITTAAAFMLFGAAAMAADRNPVGERADYMLDRATARTSSLIQSGNLTAEITQYLPDAEGGPVYDAKIDYTFRITLVGTRSGTEYVKAPEAYFTQAFLEDLRRTGHYESAQFKVDHEGFADATTLDGHMYPNCDKIKIYDIDQGFRSPLVDLARALVGPENFTTYEQIQDLVIRGHIAYGLPVLGAVKLDVSGKYSGLNIKAGADYKAP